MFEQCGTPAYIAPEILINKGYQGFGVDIWSAGVVLYAMLSGTVPFKGNNLKELHNLIISGDYKEIKGISIEAEDLLKNILEVDPNKRFKIEEILNHPWLINFDFNFWKNQNLFTNAEYVLLAKSNVDYRNIAFKEDMIENFDIRNLDTIEDIINKNVNTKSLILAPFNTSVSDNEENEFDSGDEKDEKMIDINNPDLKILNGVIKYVAKVRDLNRNYELNNNQEIDNGVVITPNDSEDKEKKNENNLGNSSYNHNYNNKFKSRHISPPNELNDYSEKNDDNEINENALDMLQNLGYKKSYVKKYLKKNEFNYATTSYNLICKYCFS
jgi:serine/threonine protein kinase